MSAGIRIADWGQRIFTGVLFGTTIYLTYKVVQGGNIVKTKIKSEQEEREARMREDLKRWKEEDEKVVQNSNNGGQKKD